MAYITVYYIDFDTKEVISTYDYSLEVGQTQNINVQDHIPAGYLDLFTYNNGNFVYDNSIQVVADEPLYVNGQTGDRFTNNVLCFASATWDGTSNLPIDDLSDGIEGMSVVPVHTSEIAPIDIVDSISITENAMSGQFLTIGDVCYPTCSVSLFKGEYTTATVFLKGSEFYVVAQIFGIYQILGKFTITNEPVVGTDTVSFEASGVLSSEGINSVVDLTEVLTEQRKAEILEVQPSLESIVSPTNNNMSYYWYFIVEDIYELFGIPLIIDRWDYCREDFLASNNIMELLIPTKTISTSDTDEDGVIETTIENEKEITWKDIICNIALLLNCNIVEHGGVIHLKRLPTMGSKAKKFYVGADIYDDNSRFSSNNYWLKSTTIKYREYAIRNTFPQPTLIGGPEDAVFWGNGTRNHTAFEGIPTSWNAGAIEYETTVNCAYFRPYFWRSTQTNKQLINLLGNIRAAKALYRSFDIDEDITWEGLNVFNGVPDVVYTPADVNFLGWNPLMSIGNCFICADYEGDNRIIYVGNQTISYSGGVTVSVSSTCNLEDGTSSEYTTSEISSTATGGVANIQSIVNQMLEGVLIRDNVLNGSKITDATITGGKITDATITGGKIANSTITSTQIADSTITNSKIANSTITGSKIVDGTLDGSTKIANATISYAKMDSSFVGSLVADSAFVTELQAEIASFGYITSQQADLDYAQIDFANVANGAIKTALIQDGAITDAKIGGVSANKLTAGTIDASNITVTNLNATNITTGRITVDGITIDVTNNEASIDGGYIENGTITINGLSSDVVARIDGAIETFTCTDVPTLQNYPASTWTSSDYDKHVGDVAYVVNPSSSADGYTYRFTKSSNNQFSWVLIKDTDITKALQDIIDIQGDISAIESFDSTVSSFMTNTDSEITSLKGRTSSLETTMGTKVDTSTFNTLSQTVDTNTSNITTLTTTTDSLGTRMTQAESDITQNAQAITTKVSTTDFTGQNMMSLINQDASSVTISASKVNLDGAVTFSSFSSALQNQVTGISNTANSAYAHTQMLDTRNDNQPPSWYTAKTRGIYNEFKLCSTIGISTTATYCYLTTYVPWQGLSGGLPIQEATFSESDAVYRRYGTSASEWSAWKSTSKILAGWQYSDTTYIDGGNIYTGTITAGKITVSNLSTISANMGEITAGTLKSDNYVADTSGMKLTLSDGVWDSKDFKISSTGAITSTAGTIGGWTINNNTLTSIIHPEDETEVTRSAIISSSDTSITIKWSEGLGSSMYSKLEYSQLITHYGNLLLQRDACYTDKKAEIEYTAGGSYRKHYLCEYGINFTDSSDRYSGDSAMLKLTDVNGGVTIGAKTNDGIVITNNSSNVFSVSTTGAITASGLITAKNGVDSWGKLEGNTLKINNTGASSFNILGGGSIAGTLAVGGNITSNNKNVVVDNYASGFMAFTNDTASATSVTSSTSNRYNLASVTLTPGVYIIECVAEWRSNSTTGYRDICLSTTSQGGKIDKYCESTVAPSSAYDRQIFTYTTHITSNTTFYLTAQQNSGSSISTLGGIRALRIGNN